MIKVTLSEVKTQEKPFPKLMINKETKLIVLFYEERKGTVIKDPVAYYKEGSNREDWIMNYFTNYNEPITIQNA